MSKTLLPIALLLSFLSLRAQVGDTVTIQTFTFGSIQNDWFEFPPDTETYEKILLYYKLKCDPGTTADGYECGEWDYLTYTYLYDHTGELDSNLLNHPNFLVGGQSPDSFVYSNTPTYTYTPRWEYSIVYDDTLTWNTGTVGSGVISSPVPFETSKRGVRSQFIWRATELSGAGLTAGDITGMGFDFGTLSPAALSRLQVRMKATSDSVVSAYLVPADSFVTVFDHAQSFGSTGWNTLAFTTPFGWNGTANVLVEICFDVPLTGTDFEVLSTDVGYDAGVHVGQNDYYLDFEDADHVSIDGSIFSGIDSFLTISLWQYGDPVIQPQSDMIFEARDSNNNRQVNVHLPWGNSQVYWDCGNDGTGYDRINKSANAQDFRGQWNHWTFTKDVAKGEMQVFLNGELWHSGAGKNRTISGVENFILGASGSLGNHYDGFVDELFVWDAVLDTATVRHWMTRSYDNSHPNASNLVAYFDFNEGAGIELTDELNSFEGTISGLADWKSAKGCDLFKDIGTTTTRPNVLFEQGTFDSHLDSSIVVDSTINPIRQLIIFGDSLNATTATDTQYVYDAAYRYTFDVNGNVVDSSWQGGNTIHHKLNYYYGAPFEVIERYELFRYITPYGIGLDLGQQGDGEGFTWIFDVSDFEPLLHDSVHLSAGNNQEFLDMKFVMIKGTPPREVLDVQNVYSGSHAYNSNIETNFLTPKGFYIPHSAGSVRIRVNNTGHGFGGNLNCAEFCPRDNTLYVNGTFAFQEHLWRGDCDLNPVYPQGGTWIYDRANWCPGAEVNPSMWELMSFISPGDSIEVDYNMQSGYTWNGSGSQPRYVVESQLITYGSNSFNLDASIEDIIAPNKYEGYKRWNPRCNNVIVKIKNTGTQDLTSLDIEYGPLTGSKATYNWTGNLKFLEEETVELPPSDWGGWTGGNIFEATISNPNGGTDEYARNNNVTREFEQTPLYPANFLLQFQTNSAGWENSYKIFDAAGNVVHERNAMLSNTNYRDTFNLPNGCYRLVIYDSDEDGISFFANNDGAGSIRLKEVGGSYFKVFQPNFGGEIAQGFTVGYLVGTDEPSQSEIFSVQPNPTDGMVYVDVQLATPSNIELTLHDGAGRTIATKHARHSAFEQFTYDLTGNPAGMYFLRLRYDDGIKTLKLIRQ